MVDADEDPGRERAHGPTRAVGAGRSAVLVTGVIGAVVGAGFAAWQRRRAHPAVDPWVEATASRTSLLPPPDDGREPPEGPRAPSA